MSQPSRRRFMVGLTVAAASLGICRDVWAGFDEFEVKGAFALKFLSFCRWPDDAFASATAPLVFGTVGTDPFGGKLKRLTAGRRVSGHTIEIQHFDSIPAVRGCHAVFAHALSAGAQGDLAKKARAEGILTISDIRSFASSGGMIELGTDDQKVSFEVNLRPVRNAKLQLSSKMLKLATTVLK